MAIELDPSSEAKLLAIIDRVFALFSAGADDLLAHLEYPEHPLFSMPSSTHA